MPFYVNSFEIIDPKFPISRKVTFTDGSSRIENIVQNETQNKLMVIQFASQSLPKGIKAAEYAIFISYKDNKCNITWRAKMEGSGDAKKVLITQLTSEFENYAIGFEKLTRKAIPAIKMN